MIAAHHFFEEICDLVVMLVFYTLLFYLAFLNPFLLT